MSNDKKSGYTAAQIKEAREYHFRRDERTGKPWGGKLAYYTEEEDNDAVKKTRHMLTRTFTPEEAHSESQAKKAVTAWHIDLVRDAERREAEAASARRQRYDVADYCDAFIQGLYEGGAVNPSTYRGYLSCLNRVRARFAGTMLDELTPQAIEGWERDMLRTLAPYTVVHAHVILKEVLHHAVAVRDLEWNPADAVRPPKRPHVEPNALGTVDRGRLLDALDQMEYSPIVLAARIALMTGMRRGEICGLRWKDVDLHTGVIHVRNAIGIAKGGTYQKEPKTGASLRDIPIAPELVGTLKDRRADMFEKRLAASELTAETFGELFVIGDIDGSYHNPTLITREWKILASVLGLKGTQSRVPTFHDLRHTFITAALIDGHADVKTVASMAGHSNVAETLNIYASADGQAQRRTADRMGDVFAAERATAAEARKTEEARRGKVYRIADGRS
jgi:integrase